MVGRAPTTGTCCRRCCTSARRYDLLFYDQRGGGLSKADARIPITWQTHVEDLAAVVAEFALEPLSIVGYSWGAMLALLYAIEQREKPSPRAARRDWRSSIRRL